MWQALGGNAVGGGRPGRDLTGPKAFGPSGFEVGCLNGEGGFLAG